MLALRCGPFPEVSLQKAEHACGDDIGRALVWVVERLSHPDECREASLALGMDRLLLEQAVLALSHEVCRLRPGLLQP
jgi:hypothetical protein